LTVCALRDDTLLCSSFLSSKGLRLDSDPNKVRTQGKRALRSMG